METLRVGPPLDKAIDIGAIVSPVQLESIRKMVDAGVAEGAHCWQPSNPVPQKGSFFPPTLLTDVHPGSTVVQEEIFGPVLVAMTFRTPAEAAELANNTIYGLAASIWSENINVALDLASQVKAGVVWVNCTNQFDAACGFGGYRESGYGREGGREGMYEYLTPKWLHSLPTAAAKPTPFVAPDEAEGDDSQAAPAYSSGPILSSSNIDRTVNTSAANRRAPTPATRSPFTAATANCLAMRRSATAKTFAMQLKPRATHPDGQELPRTIARRFFTSSPKT
jgi:aldehyde dehydrogenase (NAD+)